MTYLSGTEAADHVDDLVHADTQIAPDGVDCTVDRVFRIVGSGALDFGGGEFEAAERERIDPRLADESDTYGWWSLPEGTYGIRYNESLALPRGTVAVLEPLRRLLRAGAHHPTVHPEESDGPLTMTLSVGAAGCRIKENARLSRLRIRGKP